jgi:hypothetical protein
MLLANRICLIESQLRSRHRFARESTFSLSVRIQPAITVIRAGVETQAARPRGFSESSISERRRNDAQV